MSCTNIQSSLGWCQGTPELPGVKRRIYYTSKNNIVTWPSLPHDVNGRVTGANLVGSFVLAADTYFHYIDILPDKSQLTSEAQGELPSQTQLNKLTAVHPGVGPEASAAAAYINNTDNVFIVEDMKGRYRVLGCDKWSTKATVAQDLGQGATGSTSTTITVEATDEIPSPFYTGQIVTEEGTINEAAGTTAGGASADDDSSGTSGSGTTTGDTTVGKKTLTLSSSPSSGGTVSGAGSYDSGTEVTITATPASGYEFSMWSDGNKTNPRTITLNSDTSLIAIFKVPQD